MDDALQQRLFLEEDTEELSEDPEEDECPQNAFDPIKWCNRLSDKMQKNLFAICLVLVFVAIFCVSFQLRKPNSPVLLMSTHDGNIAAFNPVIKDGIITTSLLNLDTTPLDDLRNKNHIQFRGLYVTDKELVAVNGNNNDTFIAVFKCEPNRDLWDMVGYYSQLKVFGLEHPYGVDYYQKFGLYVISVQKANCIFLLDNGFNLVHKISTHIPAVIGFRGLAVDSTLDMIFVASPDSKNIIVFDIGKQFQNTFNISLPQKKNEPISVLLDEQKNVLFVSDRQNHKIFAFDYWSNGTSLKWTSQNNSWLQRPTGLALQGGELFVIAQKINKILVYSSENGRYLSELASWKKYEMERGEQLVFIPQGHRCALN